MLLKFGNILLVFFKKADDVAVSVDVELLRLEFHFGAAVLWEEDSLTDADRQWEQVSILIKGSWANSDDGAHVRVGLGLVSEDDATS